MAADRTRPHTLCGLTTSSSEDAVINDRHSTLGENLSRNSTSPSYQVPTFADWTTAPPLTGRRKKVLNWGLVSLVAAGVVVLVMIVIFNAEDSSSPKASTATTQVNIQPSGATEEASCEGIGTAPKSCPAGSNQAVLIGCDYGHTTDPYGGVTCNDK